MIKRIYVNNFRTLVNFELELDPLVLLLGPNGAGKSSVFDVLHKLRRFVVEGDLAKSIFPLRDLTKWPNRAAPEQSFEIEIADEEGLYRYRLSIEHDPDRAQTRMKSESLTIDGKPLFEFAGGNAQLFRDDHTMGPNLPFDWSRSGVGFFMDSHDNKKLTRFKQRLASTLVIRPNPFLMGSESREEEEHPKPDLSNFASWYRHISLEHPSRVSDLRGTLRGILDGFDCLMFGTVGEAKILSALFTGQSGEIRPFKLNRLSDGQRMLIALYTLLHCAFDGTSVLCIDEPENYLALPEIQPWLDAAIDRVENTGGQLVLISHHPRLINWLSRDQGIWFYRDSDNGPTRVKRIDGEAGSGLPISQLVERGWILDEYADE